MTLKAASLWSAPPGGDTDEDLVARCWGGDDQALDSLLQRYRNFVRVKSRSYFLVGADSEDVVQEGMIGLYKAIRDFQPEKNTAFRAFAELCVTRQIITAIKTASRQKHMPLNSYVSLNKPAEGSQGEERSLEEALANPTISDPAELVVSADEIESIKASVGRVLSQFETEVLQLYMDGKSYQQIADMLGRHVKSIDNALQRIKRKLEPHMLGRSA
ncbi:MAG TPA: RNA polymerase sporulation sigma factor SigH [Actinomycetota bacterium]|nr:RNA polymerase sporulation sigma factor SigH [Actinomycetota bacterium]